MVERSYGVIPACIKQDGMYILLVLHKKGHIGFPKGHSEKNETAYQAAARELYEETGLSISKQLTDRVFTERYSYKKDSRLIPKQVDYFLCLVKGDVNIQEEEIEDFYWVPVLDLRHKITFKEGKKLIDELNEFLNTHSK